MRDYKLTLNLITNEAPDRKKFKQFDKGNEIELELFQNENLQEKEKLVLTNETVLAFFKREDNIVLQKKCGIRNGNVIVTTSKDVLGVPGKLELECMIKNGDVETTTTTLNFIVDESILRDEAIENDPRYYSDLVTDLLDVRDNVLEQTLGRIDTVETSLLEKVDNKITIHSNDKSKSIDQLALVEVDKFIDKPIMTPNSYDESSPHIDFVGTWGNSINDVYESKKIRQTSIANSYYEFTFYGCEFEIFGSKSRIRGISELYIDGVKHTEIDQYSAASNHCVSLFKSDKLIKGLHKVRVVCTGRSNPESTGVATDIDYIAIDTNIYKQDEDFVKYTGSAGLLDTQGYFKGSGCTVSAPSYCTFSFTGSGLVIYTLINSFRGGMRVIIDGIISAEIDCYSSEVVDYQKRIFQVKNLKNKDHIVVIEPYATESGRSTIVLQRFDLIEGNLTDNTDIRSYSEKDQKIKYTGSWLDTPNSGFYGGNAKACNSPCSFEFKFRGTGFNWIGRLGTECGKFDMYLDGSKVTGNLYSTSLVNAYKKTCVSRSNMPYGEHTVRIEGGVEADPLATNKYMFVDKIDIIGGEMIG